MSAATGERVGKFRARNPPFFSNYEITAINHSAVQAMTSVAHLRWREKRTMSPSVLKRYSCIRKPQSYPQSYAQVWDLLVENVQKAVDNSVGELGKTVDKSAKISGTQQGCG